MSPDERGYAGDRDSAGGGLHEEGGSARPQGEDDVPGLEIGGNNDSGGPEGDPAKGNGGGGNASGGALKVVNGLRTRMRSPHASQN